MRKKSLSKNKSNDVSIAKGQVTKTVITVKKNVLVIKL